MTREEAIKGLKAFRREFSGYEPNEEMFDMAIKALEQDTVPFDFELYQAGLMEMPKGMIDVLDKIKTEIIDLRSKQNVGALECLAIIDKYRKE